MDNAEIVDIKFCNQNTAMLIVLRENSLYKTSTWHRKNSKQSGIVAIARVQVSSWCLAEKNKELAKTNLKNVDKAMPSYRVLGQG